MRCLFVSDAHYPKNDAIINFLLDVYCTFDKIFILGDLFEFYYGYKGFFYSHHIKLINLLGIISKKTEVILVEGNHEYNLENIKAFVNVEVVKRHRIFLIDSLKVYVEHGDSIDKKDISYRIFRAFLKNRITLKIIDNINPSFLYFMSQKASEFSKKRLKIRSYRGTQREFELFAKKIIDNGADIVVLAHTHKPAIKRFGKGLYINTGDFFEHFSYVVYDSKTGFSLKFF